MQGNMENGKKLDRVMRLPELAKTFGVCERTVRRRSDCGELPELVRVGHAVGMLESKVEAHLDRLRTEKAA